MLSGQLVEVIIECEGDEYVDRYDGRIYRVPKGRKTLLPIEAVRLWFGWPDIDKMSEEEKIAEQRRITARRGTGVGRLVHASLYEIQSTPAKEVEVVEEEEVEEQEEAFADLETITKPEFKPKLKGVKKDDSGASNKGDR